MSPSSTTLRRWRVITNLRAFNHPDCETVVVETGASGAGRWTSAWRLARMATTADAVLLNCAVADTLALCVLLRLMPWVRTRLVVSDPVMNPPVGPFGVQRAALKKWLLRRVDRFVTHQRDLSAYDRWYGIGPSRSTFVPFKVNLREVVERLEVTDGDYIFACGITNRDWPTLGAATRNRPYPVVVSMPDDEQLRRMGAIAIAPRRSDFSEAARFVVNGADPEEWLRLAAGARLIVLPVTTTAINPSGVSTLLSLMALGKCLVISDGPATRDVVTEQAIVVAPGDPEALGQAIDRAWGDAGLRERVAEQGKAFAASLGGAERLLGDLARIVVDEVRRAG